MLNRLMAYNEGNALGSSHNRAAKPQRGGIGASLISPFQGFRGTFSHSPGAAPQAFTCGSVGAGRRV